MAKSTSAAGGIVVVTRSTSTSGTPELVVAGERTKGRKAILRIHSTDWTGESVTLRSRLMGSDTATYHDSPTYRKVSSTTDVAGGTAITASGIYEVFIDAQELYIEYVRSGGTLTVEAVTLVA